ncbi:MULTISPECIES: hemolysin family protein [unclassified Methanoculleus]|uniref:hemolysin family protein n=1 Tax=unclassified Methanoculleus TaxID=2619537 RepID=UPI0025D19931|nr:MULTISPECIES: hemolysin family protein [unclassified Methanoculleus]MCK9318981.1 hemolysin family protein [Methanoculleus sp.]MDD2253884.1 hemolysin family protein [Methanoculleus sp.]MDD2786734.1 hemolysin family protein [Methanoculleus sp.]MDD3215583.1 hemolysin family protein [Methanoculleus sp.]MDD4314865.1 hemolysin family protein [Methanoculleus sp.]
MAIVDLATIEIILLFISLFLSGFFSSSEVALISITRAKVHALLNQGRKGAKALDALKRSTDRIELTTLIGNTVANVAVAVLATAIAIGTYGNAGIVMAFGVTVLLILMFGEIGPKMYASRHTEDLALRVARPILYLSTVLYPVLWVSDRIKQQFAFRPGVAEPVVTEEEIKEWIDVGEEEGTIEEEERDMLYSVLRFGDTTVREVMTPRVDVVMIEDTSSLENALSVFNETGFSRIPVYHERIDNVIGLLNIKDLFAAVFRQQTSATIRDLMYEPYFVPESKKIDELLKELQVKKQHMAVVLDEYGSFAGIVTVEDMLEELVGEIMDEFDEEEPEVQRIEEGVYVVDARAWVEHLNEDLDLNLPVMDSYESIGGLVIDRLGHIPRRGEVVKIEESNITLVVMQMRGRRIVKVKMIITPAEAR